MTAPAPIMPRYSVEPPAPALPAPYSLLSVATVLDDVPVHALTGVQYEAVCSTRVDGYPAPCEPGTGTLSRQKDPHPTVSDVIATPFALYAADSCVLARDEATALAQLRQRFTAGEPAAVEHIVETGVLANWPNLQRTPVTVLPAASGQYAFPDAVGLLEQWLAETTGSAGVIHAPRTAGPRAFTTMQAVTAGARAETRLGSQWVFGTGYTGTPPEGITDTGNLWLYATPQVTIRRSDLMQPATWHTGAFNRADNTALLLYERIYVVDWPYGVAAVDTGQPRPGYSSAAARHHTTASVTEQE